MERCLSTLCYVGTMILLHLHLCRNTVWGYPSTSDAHKLDWGSTHVQVISETRYYESKSVHHLSDVIRLIILVLIQTKALSSAIAQSRINSVGAHSSKSNLNGFMNAHSGRLMGSYSSMRTPVHDGRCNRHICKERRNYYEGFNYQNCLKNRISVK
jgi:hypothetical protein